MRKERLSQILIYLLGWHMKSEFRAISFFTEVSGSFRVLPEQIGCWIFQVWSSTVNPGMGMGGGIKKEELVKPKHIIAWPHSSTLSKVFNLESPLEKKLT